MGFWINQNKRVNTQQCENDHCDIKQVSSCQNDSKIANLLSYYFVLEWVEAKEVRLFYVVQAFGTLVHSLLCQSDQEWHHQHTQQAEDENAENCKQIAQQIRLVSHYRVRHCITVWTLDLLWSRNKQCISTRLSSPSTYFSSNKICYCSSSLGANMKAAGLISDRGMQGADSRSALSISYLVSGLSFLSYAY